MIKQNRYFKELQNKVILSLMDIIILQIIKDEIMSGHEIIKEINKQFNILISSGTIYPILTKLKKQKLIKSKKKNGRKAYYSTKYGKVIRRLLIMYYMNLQKSILSYLRK